MPVDWALSQPRAGALARLCSDSCSRGLCCIVFGAVSPAGAAQPTYMHMHARTDMRAYSHAFGSAARRRRVWTTRNSRHALCLLDPGRWSIAKRVHPRPPCACTVDLWQTCTPRLIRASCRQEALDEDAAARPGGPTSGRAKKPRRRSGDGTFFWSHSDCTTGTIIRILIVRPVQSEGTFGTTDCTLVKSDCTTVYTRYNLLRRRCSRTRGHAASARPAEHTRSGSKTCHLQQGS